MAALTVFLLVCGNSVSAVVLILIVWALVLLTGLILTYWKRKRQMKKLLDMAEQLSERYLISEVPIIFVTSCNTDMDELNSIMLGGDAFITKPYNTAILLAKIASLLKKAYPAQQQEQIAYGDAVLHLESSSLDYHGQSVELTKNELKILYYLFKNGGKICSRGDMIEYLWDNQLYVDDNALSVNINRIREKLAGIGLTDFIKTKHRQGYTI